MRHRQWLKSWVARKNQPNLLWLGPLCCDLSPTWPTVSNKSAKSLKLVSKLVIFEALKYTQPNFFRGSAPDPAIGSLQPSRRHPSWWVRASLLRSQEPCPPRSRSLGPRTSALPALLERAPPPVNRHHFNNSAENSSNNFPSYPPGNRHRSDVF